MLIRWNATNITLKICSQFVDPAIHSKTQWRSRKLLTYGIYNIHPQAKLCSLWHRETFLMYGTLPFASIFSKCILGALIQFHWGATFWNIFQWCHTAYLCFTDQITCHCTLSISSSTIFAYYYNFSVCNLTNIFHFSIHAAISNWNVADPSKWF